MGQKHLMIVIVFRLIFSFVCLVYPYPMDRDISQEGTPLDGDLRLNIHVHFIDSFDCEMMKAVEETVMFFSQIVNLKKSVKSRLPFPFRLPRDPKVCSSVYSRGPNAGKCSSLSRHYSGDFCGIIEIPAAHLDGLQICRPSSISDTQCLNESLSPGEGFTDGTNLVVYMISRESNICQHALAHAVMCRKELMLLGGIHNGRPIAGSINLCKNHLESLKGKLLKRVIAHEIIHILGFNYKSLQEFIDCDELEEDFASEEEIWPKSGDGVDLKDEESILCWKKQNVVQVYERNGVILQSDILYDAAVQLRNITSYYVCPILEGTFSKNEDSVNEEEENFAILTDSGGIRVANTRTGLHWPDKIFPFKSSLMTASQTDSEDIIIDPLTVAFFKTSGWYTVNEVILPCLSCYLNDENISESCYSLLKEDALNKETFKSEGKQAEYRNCIFLQNLSKELSNSNQSERTVDKMHINSTNKDHAEHKIKILTGESPTGIKEDPIHQQNSNSVVSRSRTSGYISELLLLIQVIFIICGV